MPSLSKGCRPGTVRGHGKRSDRGRCSRSAQKCADLERRYASERPLARGGATESALTGAGVPGLSKSCRPGTGVCLGAASGTGRSHRERSGAQD